MAVKRSAGDYWPTVRYWRVVQPDLGGYKLAGSYNSAENDVLIVEDADGAET